MKYLDDADFTLYQGDALDVLRGLPAESVHCVVTSPPYWGLRDYGATGQLGLEPTPDLYIESMVAVFREVRRVLRRDGTCWVNMGDSYASNGPGSMDGGSLDAGGKQHRSSRGVKIRAASYSTIAQVANSSDKASVALKQKDLCMIPARLALALQADGWWLRSQIVWSKPNPMPESVTDRPTTSHEFVYLLAKSPRYFFDQEAVREPHTGANVVDGQWTGKPAVNRPEWEPNTQGWNKADGKGGGMRTTHRDYHPAGRNLRSVWEIPTQPYPEAHFVTYPEELVRRCILAGSSERGCCPECGAPYLREVERDLVPTRGKVGEHKGEGRADLHDAGSQWNHSGGVYGRYETETTGWWPSCDCAGKHDGTIPCTVLDPFLGSGTTALVARKHGRRCIGIELSAEYCGLAARRTQQLSLEAV